MRFLYGVYCFCALLLLLSSVQVVSADDGFTYLTQWGRNGSGDGEFNSNVYSNSPTLIPAVDNAGNVYVCDVLNYRVQKFTSTGEYITQWGSEGDGDGQFHPFNGPNAIAVDRAGNVYVSDDYGNRVQKFSSNGAFLGKMGGNGCEMGPYGFWGNKALAVDALDNVYVADTVCIKKYTSTGTYISAFCPHGTEPGKADSPRGITVDAAGYIYVADTNNYQVQKFSSTGEYIATIDSGEGFDGVTYPMSVAVDSAGNVYVSDMAGGRLLKFSSSGTFIAQWFGSPGNVDGHGTGCLAIDSDDNMYIADPHNCRIQKFALTGEISVDSITPDTAILTEKDVGVTVHGTGFTSGTSFELVNTTLGTIECLPDTITRVSSTELIGNISFRNATEGLYDVVVTAPDGSTDHLEKGFTVDNPWFKPNPDGYQFNNTMAITSGVAKSTFNSVFKYDRLYYIKPDETDVHTELFYEYFVAPLGKDGNCFGMASSSLALWKNGLTNQRAWDLGNNPNLRLPSWNIFDSSLNTVSDWIQSYNIRQRSDAVLKIYSEFKGESESIPEVYNELKARLADPISFRQNPSILQIWADGRIWHAVVPTRIDDKAGKIGLYDSNFPNFETYLQYDSRTGTVTYPKVPGWHINSLALIDLSTMEKPRIPDNLLITTGFLAFNIPYFQSRQLGQNESQTSDAPGIIPIIDEGDSSEIYYLGNQTLNSEIIGTGTGPGSVAIMRPNAFVIINASVHSGLRDEIEVPPSGSSVEYFSGSGTNSLQLSIALDSATEGRQVTIDGFDIGPSRAVNLSFGSNQNDVSVLNTGPAATVRFSLQQVGAGSGAFVPGRSLTVENASSVRIIPSDWTNLDHTTVTVEHDLHNDGVVDYSETVTPAGVPGTPTQGTPTVTSTPTPTPTVTSTPTQDPRVPVANFTWTPVNVTVGEDVQFLDTSTGNPTAWRWMQDGVNITTMQSPSMTFSIPCTRSISLMAMNSFGWSAPKTVVINVVNQTVTPTTTVKPITGGAGSPTDTNGDGTCEDVNGNGRKDFADVVLYFNQMSWIAANEPASAFDYNGNGRVDFADVVWLFNNL